MCVLIAELFMMVCDPGVICPYNGGLHLYKGMNYSMYYNMDRP